MGTATPELLTEASILKPIRYKLQWYKGDMRHLLQLNNENSTLIIELNEN